VVVGRAGAERLAATAAELRQETGGAGGGHPHRHHREAQVAALFAQTMQRFGRLDILVNNSGAFDSGRIDQLTLAAWSTSWASTSPAVPVQPRGLSDHEGRGGAAHREHGASPGSGAESTRRPTTTKQARHLGADQCTALDGREFGIAASCLNPGEHASGAAHGRAPPRGAAATSASPMISPTTSPATRS